MTGLRTLIYGGEVVYSDRIGADDVSSGSELFLGLAMPASGAGLILQVVVSFLPNPNF